jgi:hypothetical protein
VKSPGMMRERVAGIFIRPVICSVTRFKDVPI